MLVLAAFLTAVLSGVFGMAGGLLLMGVYTAALPVSAAMVLHGATQLVANGSRALLLARHVHVGGLLRYAVGALLAWVLLRELAYVPDPRVVLLVLGATPFVARLVPRGCLDFERPASSLLCGLLVGGLQLVAGVAGPLLDTFFVDGAMDRRAVVATKASTQVLSHGLKIVYFAPLLAEGAVDPGLVAGVAAAALLGTAVGSRLLDRISDTGFRSATRWLVLGIGAFYLVAAVRAW